MQTKKCFKCQKIKQLNEFYKHPEMLDGYLNKCKDCTKEDIKKSARNIKRKCLVCGNSFGTCISEINRGGGKTCSRECYYIHQKKIIKHGPKHHSWKGGRLEKGGYIFIYKPDHIMANNKGYIPEHKFVMEKKIGRPIKKMEVVHHIDENKTNNQIDNLMLFPCNGTHIAHHHHLRKIVAIEKNKLKGTKFCTKCNKELSLSEFYKCKRSKDGLSYWCKYCTNKRNYNYKSNK